MKKSVAHIAIAIILSLPILAIGQGNDLQRNNNDEPIVIDSTEQSIADSSQIVSNGFFELFHGKPGKAALYGLIPGGGQIYNRDWWKLPIVYGIEGFFIYNIITNSQTFRENQDKYLHLLTGGDPIQEGNELISDPAVYKRIRDNARRNRDYNTMFFIGGHILIILEAFIDRHLMTFDVSDDLSFRAVPIPTTTGIYPGIGVTYSLSGTSKKKAIVFP